MAERFKNYISRLISFIPNTRPYRLRIRTQILRRARERVKRFKKLRELDSETKRKLLRSVVYYETRLAGAFLRRDKARGILNIAGFILGMALLSPSLLIFKWF